MPAVGQRRQLPWRDGTPRRWQCRRGETSASEDPGSDTGCVRVCFAQTTSCHANGGGRCANACRRFSRACGDASGGGARGDAVRVAVPGGARGDAVRVVVPGGARGDAVRVAMPCVWRCRACGGAGRCAWRCRACGNAVGPKHSRPRSLCDARILGGECFGPTLPQCGHAAMRPCGHAAMRPCGHAILPRYDRPCAVNPESQPMRRRCRPTRVGRRRGRAPGDPRG
jgi:hypothetical protein